MAREKILLEKVFVQLPILDCIPPPTACGDIKELLLISQSTELHNPNELLTPNRLHDLLQLASNFNEEMKEQGASNSKC